tara:strand:+ start:2108 stop:2707 length:600 start_codon:yes stop_codon:yes gene_type:complete
MQLKDKILDVLPQTQCEQCGFKGCLPYAEAIAHKGARIDQCRPGGLKVFNKLKQITGRLENDSLEEINARQGQPKLAKVVLDECIGCTKCIDACPVDAIIGANKMLHHVIAQVCNGCELCVPACPVDCIEIMPHPSSADELLERSNEFSQRYQHKLERARKTKDDYHRRHARIKLKRADIKQTLQLRREQINRWIHENE